VRVREEEEDGSATRVRTRLLRTAVIRKKPAPIPAGRRAGGPVWRGSQRGGRLRADAGSTDREDEADEGERAEQRDDLENTRSIPPCRLCLR
jgi:hypothetical protein